MKIKSFNLSWAIPVILCSMLIAGAAFFGCSDDDGGRKINESAGGVADKTLGQGVITDTQAEITWNSAGTSFTYYLYYALTSVSGFDTVDEIKANGTLASTVTDLTSAKITSGLSTDATYYVNVIAKNSSGTETALTKMTIIIPSKVYYVSQNASGASDSNDGLSASAPFATINKAWTTVTAGTYNATVLVAAGDYDLMTGDATYGRLYAYWSGAGKSFKMYGGYASDFSSRNNTDRTNTTYKTRIHSSYTGTSIADMIGFDVTGADSFVIDGFVIDGYDTAVAQHKVALRITKGTSVYVTNNDIKTSSSTSLFRPVNVSATSALSIDGTTINALVRGNTLTPANQVGDNINYANAVNYTLFISLTNTDGKIVIDGNTIYGSNGTIDYTDITFGPSSNYYAAVHIWGSTRNVYLVNNTIYGPNFTNFSSVANYKVLSAALDLQASDVSRIYYVFNNTIICGSGQIVKGIINRMGQNLYINNTIYGGSVTGATSVAGIYACFGATYYNAVFKNNIVSLPNNATNMYSMYIYSSSAKTDILAGLTIGYNCLYVNGTDKIGYGTSEEMTTTPTALTTTELGTGNVAADPAINTSTCKLTSSSPSAVTEGGNNESDTSDYLTKDKAGTERPSTGSWAMGAYVAP